MPDECGDDILPRQFDRLVGVVQSKREQTASGRVSSQPELVPPFQVSTHERPARNKQAPRFQRKHDGG